MNHRDLAGNAEEEEEKMVNPRDLAGNTEEEEVQDWWSPEV